MSENGCEHVGRRTERTFYVISSSKTLCSAGFVWALEILENHGKFLKPWKPLEKAWNFFIKPWKSRRTSLKNKFMKWCILLISLQLTIITKLHFVLETTA